MYTWLLVLLIHPGGFDQWCTVSVTHVQTWHDHPLRLLLHCSWMQYPSEKFVFYNRRGFVAIFPRSQELLLVDCRTSMQVSQKHRSSPWHWQLLAVYRILTRPVARTGKPAALQISALVPAVVGFVYSATVSGHYLSTPVVSGIASKWVILKDFDFIFFTVSEPYEFTLKPDYWLPCLVLTYPRTQMSSVL